eukprot:3857653-Rhodomonas_salina.3
MGYTHRDIKPGHPAMRLRVSDTRALTVADTSASTARARLVRCYVDATWAACKAKCVGMGCRSRAWGTDLGHGATRLWAVQVF